MSRLVAFGCSFTYGHGLRDCDYDSEHATDPRAIDTSSLHAWPEVAASQLGMHCVNLSRPGESNRYIAQCFVDFDFQPTDIAVVMWTLFPRRSFIQDNGVSLPLSSAVVCDTDHLDTITDIQQRASTAFFKYVYTDKDSIFDNLVYVNLTNYLAKARKIMLVNSSVILCPTDNSDLIADSDACAVPWNAVDPVLVFDDHFVHGYARDGHPSEESHRSFGLRLAEHIQNTRLTA